MKYFNLKDCTSIQRGLTFKKSDVVDHSDLKVLRSNNIDFETYTFLDKDFSYLNQYFNVESKYLTKKNDIIICMSTGSKKHLGKVAIIENDNKYIVGGFLGKITANNDILNSKYLYYFLINPKTKDIISDSVVSMSINNLRMEFLNNLQIPIPSLKKQEKIVDNLDNVFENINKNKTLVNAQLHKLSELEKTILNKEFSYE